jgi:60 kDa SS-A/Ro ribonucleoprotein
MRMNIAARLGHNLPTFEGAPAKRINPEQQLRRSVLACLLWESQFYEDGTSIAERIEQEAQAVSPECLAGLAVEARRVHGLRHVPLLLTSLLAKSGGKLVADTIEQVVDRADETAEFLSIYWRNGKRPLSAQVKKGLARALRKFDAYQLAKYNRDNAIKLRDVLFMVHAKPKDEDQAATWRALSGGTLETPDTWEVALSGGADKRETFERLLRENKLGYLALLRNLRNMAEAGVDTGLMREAVLARRGASKVFPFRYVAAARACPQMEPSLDQALSAAIAEMPVLSGRTAILVDVSGSMNDKLSAKSDLKRMDAAAALASIIHGERRVFTFSSQIVEVPPRHGMAGVDTIIRSQPHSSTYLGQAVQAINQQVPHDRLIVITDEQSADRVPDPVVKKAYMINVASYRNGVGYGRWTHVDGFSEGVLRYISLMEEEGA